MIEEKIRVEFVYVDRLVVRRGVAVFECLLRNEVHDVVVIVDAHHCAVHPCLVFRHEGAVAVRRVQGCLKHGILEDEI